MQSSTRGQHDLQKWVFGRGGPKLRNHGHGDSMTNAAQWGRVDENYLTRKLVKSQSPYLTTPQNMTEFWFAAPTLTQVLDSVIFGGGQLRTKVLFWILAHKEIRGGKKAETPFNDQFVNYSPL